MNPVGAPLQKHRVVSRAFAVLSLLAASLPVLAATQETADTNFADQKWQEARDDYLELLGRDEADSNNWFQLARSHEALEDFHAAFAAMEKAIAAGYQPRPRAHYALARLAMKLNDEDAALHQLERVGEMGGPHFRTVLAQPEFASLLGQPRFLAVIEALTPCATEQHRQFDFWVGEWDVVPAAAPQATASNSITISQDGCVVIEQYVNGNFTGMSINFYDNASGKWHQTWMSNAGGALYMEGGLTADGAMEMSDAGLPGSQSSGRINRTVWMPLDDGSVQQTWTTSTDNGESWSVVFDGRYTRKKTVGRN